jgi:hypothetical protein
MDPTLAVPESCPSCGQTGAISGIPSNYDGSVIMNCTSTTCIEKWQSWQQSSYLTSNNFLAACDVHTTGFTELSVQDALNTLFDENKKLKEDILKLKKIESDPMAAIRRKVANFSLNEEKYSIDNPPPYVKMLSDRPNNKPTVLRYRKGPNDYYKDAGAWEVDWTFKDGKFYSASTRDYIHARELDPCTKQDWEADNKGY